MTEQERIGLDHWIVYGDDGNHGMGWDEPEADYCNVCDTKYHKDDGEFCECHCQECGEELPESENDDAHCTNCCECEACMEAYREIEKIHEATGEWKDMPVITGEKVFSN